MIASNHHKIYLDIYDDLIRGLERNGLLDEASPFALYLGNWMADFSQLYTPDIPNMLIDKASVRVDDAKLRDDVRDALSEKLRLLKAFHRAYLKNSSAAVTRQQVASITSARMAVEREEALQTNPKLGKQSLDRGATPAHVRARETDPLRLKTAIAHVIDQEVLVPLIGVVQALPDFSAAIAGYVNEFGNAVRRRFVDHQFTDRFNDTMHVLIWLLGLCEFSSASRHPVQSPSASKGPLPKEYIDPDEFSRLFAKYFGFYKPYEHLDRFLSLAKLKQKASIPDGECPANLSFEAKHELMKARIADYRAFLVDITPACVKEVSTVEQRKIREVDVKVDHVLWSSLEIAFGRMAELALPANAELPINDRLLLLGRSLHVVEDYFSHTTFLDRLIFNSELEGTFETHPFERRKILLNVLNEESGVPLAAPVLLGLHDLDGVVVRSALEKGLADCVKSGFYDSGDSMHSLWHLLQGKVRKALDMDDEVKDQHFIVVDALYNHIEKTKDETLKQFASAAEAIGATKKTGDSRKYDISDFWFDSLKAGSRSDALLSQDAVDQMLHGNTVFPPQSEHSRKLCELVNYGFGVLLQWNLAVNIYDGVEHLNSVEKSAAALIKARKAMLKILQALRVLFLSSRAFVRFAHKAAGGWLAPSLDFILAVGFETAKETLRRVIGELFDLGDAEIERKAKLGSHSLIAKDEDHHQKRLYAIAEQFGVMVDKACLDIVFPPKPTAAQSDAPLPVGHASLASKRLADVMGQFAYNPLLRLQGPYDYETRKYFVKTLVDPSQVDNLLKGSAYMLAEVYQASSSTGEKWPEFSNFKVAYRYALYKVAALNALAVSFDEGQDYVSMQNARFYCHKYSTSPPKQGTLVPVFIMQEVHAMRVNQFPESEEGVIYPLAVEFLMEAVSAFKGTPLDWSKYGLARMVHTTVPEWVRPLPVDYRKLANEFVSEYECIWLVLLTAPGSFGERWGLGDRSKLQAWF